MSVIEDLAKELALGYDLKRQVAFGEYKGYWVALDASEENNKTSYRIAMAVCREQTRAEAQLLKQISDEISDVVAVHTDEYRVSFQVESRETGQESVDRLKRVLSQIVEALQVNGYQSCDERNGRQGNISAYEESGCICFYEKHTVEQLLSSGYEMDEGKGEQVLLGVLGAVLGALVGALILIFLGRFGIVATVAGFALGFLTLGGYKVFAGKMSNKGIEISIIVMIITVWFSERIGIAMQVAEALDWSVQEAFSSLGGLMSEGLISRTTYFTNMLAVYLFSGVGAWRVISSAVSKAENVKFIRKL